MFEARVIVCCTALTLISPGHAIAQDDIFAAIKAGDATAVRLFIDQNGDVNTKSRSQRPLLFAAFKAGKLEICRILVDAGADIEAISHKIKKGGHVGKTNPFCLRFFDLS